MKRRSARRIHLFLAYTVAFGLLFITITGLLLNHTQFFNLANTSVNNQYILTWYGIEPTKPSQAYKVEDNWIVNTSEGLYWNHDLLPFEFSNKQINKVFNHSGFIYLVSSNQLYLLTTDGDWVDQIKLPSKINIENTIWITSENAPFIGLISNKTKWALSQELIFEVSQTSDQYSKKSSIKPFSQNSRELQEWSLKKPSNLKWEKVILELHNGYFFGDVGPWILDLLGLLIIMMIITGLRLKL